MEKFHRWLSVCLLLGGVLLLTGCNDEAKLQKAAQLGNDGVAAAQALSDYAQGTSSILARQCDLTNFSAMLAARRTKTDLQTLRQELKTCAADPNQLHVMAELATWSQDAVAMGKVYGALSKFAGPGEDQTMGAAVNALSISVASATKLHVSGTMAKALDALTAAIADHQTAKGVEAFAHTMADMPTQLASILDEPKTAKALDSIYSVYDQDLQFAVKAAYRADAVDPDSTLQAFYKSLGLQMPPDLQNDPYAIAFAQSLHPRPIAPLGAQERRTIVGMLQNLSQETAELQALNGQHESIRSQIAELKSLRGRINSMVDASGSTP